MRVVVCPICQSPYTSVLRPYRGEHRIFNGLMLAQCHFCSMVFTAPMPSHNDLHNYNSTYFASAHGGSPSSPGALAFFSAISRLRVAYLDRYLISRQVTVSTVLEFGPGPGYFARRWLEMHPGTVYLACETDTSCHDRLENLGVQVVCPESLTHANHAIDLVVMSHVLEHVTAPRMFLENATRTLRPGGILFIEVPCLDYQHKPLDEPHLLFFDKQPLASLLHSAGFDDIELAYYGRQLDDLRSHSVLRKAWMTFSARLINRGIYMPFPYDTSCVDTLSSSLERAVASHFKANTESLKPAWWLRALACKT